MFCALLMGTNLWQALKVFKLFRLLGNATMEILVCEKEGNASINSVEQKSAKQRKVREYFMKPKIETEVWICSLDYRNISYSASENILSKVILKYHVLMLILPSHVSQNPFQNNKQTRLKLLK